jgi:hypothetical protein
MPMPLGYNVLLRVNAVNHDGLFSDTDGIAKYGRESQTGVIIRIQSVCVEFMTPTLPRVVSKVERSG